jgi:sulfur carrier protein
VQNKFDGMQTLSATKELQILLNGKPAMVRAASLAELVLGQDLHGQRIATAVNGRFVPEAQRATTALASGDQVEIVSPRQGG